MGKADICKARQLVHGVHQGDVGMPRLEQGLHCSAGEGVSKSGKDSALNTRPLILLIKPPSPDVLLVRVTGCIEATTAEKITAPRVMPGQALQMSQRKITMGETPSPTLPLPPTLTSRGGPSLHNDP